MRQTSLILIIALFCYSFSGWKIDYWEVLQGMERKAKFLPHTSSYESKIKFSKAVERLEGKKIRLRGYFVEGFNSLNEQTHTFFREANPALTLDGPNVEEMVALAKELPFTIVYGKAYVLEGFLKLNAIDRFELPYKLERVKCNNCKEK